MHIYRSMRWPLYVQNQRKIRVLQHRLKIPPTVHQFSKTLDRVTKSELFKFAGKYKPEGKKDRARRLKANAVAKAADPKADVAGREPHALMFGLQAVTRAIEQKRAGLVCIAHDVDPLENVIWMPALCRKMEVPFAIVKGKASLGKLCGFKTATCVAFTKIRPSDKPQFDKIVESVFSAFNDKYDDVRKHWGGGSSSKRSQNKLAKRLKLAAAQAR